MQFVRFNAVGPEDPMDWLAALDTVTNRLDTVERLVRRHAETITNQYLEMHTLRSGCRAVAKDIEDYKQYNQRRFEHVEKVTEQELRAIKLVVTDLETVHFLS